MKKLTQKQIDARMIVYDEVIDHLDGDIYDTATELEQGKIIRQQIKKLSENWFFNLKKDGRECGECKSFKEFFHQVT